MRVVFAGTPQFAVPTLVRLVENGVDVIAVYTNPDRPAGRGRQIRPSPVKTAAERYSLPVIQPSTLKSKEVCADLKALDPTVLVVVAYGQILPPAILAVPASGCVNVHASLLPRWRGAAPIARAIEAGDKRTGITIMKMDSGLDTGPILAARGVPIGLRDTTESMHAALARVGAELLMDTLPGYVRGEVPPVPQDQHGETYAPKLTKSEAAIDWRRPAAQISNQIRAFYPWPVACTYHGEERIRVLDAEVIPGLEPPPGELPAGTIYRSGKAGVEVACGKGGLNLVRLQRDNGRPLPAHEFLNGYPLPAGACLS